MRWQPTCPYCESIKTSKHASCDRANARHQCQECYLKKNLSNSSTGTLSMLVVFVKGGKIRPTDVRDLRGTFEREKTAASLICLQEPTKAMLQEIKSARFYELNGTKYHKIHLLTIKDMLEDKKIFYIPNKITYKEKTNQLKLYL